MKRNIDLTLNRDFNAKQREENFNIVFSSLLNNKRIPWSLKEFVELHCEANFKNGFPIPTGFVKNIKFNKKYAGEFCNGEVCDCCGKPLKFNILEETFCKECKSKLYKECGPKFPWSKCCIEMIPQDQLALYLNVRLNKNHFSWEEM